MSDEPEEPQGRAEGAKLPKGKADDNPWYLLATLYGVPKPKELELSAKNRSIWNHCLATFLDVHERASLINKGRYTEAELVPCYPISWEAELADAFTRRISNTAQSQALAGFFRAATNLPDIDFSNAEFDFDVSFWGYLFTVPIFFNKTRFSEFAGFQDAIFFRGAQFNGASFKMAHFDNAEFWGASFQSATFAKSAVFKGATFAALGAHFEEAEFRYADFSNATFNTGASFNDSKMNGQTLFKGSTFDKSPPQFFGAKLHEGTVWPSRKAWPIPKSADEAEDFIPAYERLKLEMNGLQKHEDELDFFALELQSRRVKRGPVCGFPIAIYGVLSDYGRSYVWPFVWLIAVAAYGAAIFFHFGALTLGEASGLSAANTFNVFGFRKDFIATSVIEVVAAIQTILGTILLFLFGLGVRNKFRMK